LSLLRRWLLGLLLGGMCLPCLAGAAPLDASGSGGEPPTVVVEYREGSYYGTLSFTVPVPPAVALEVLTDFEHMANFVPNLTSSKLLSQAGNIYRIAQQGTANFGPFSFSFESERQVEVFPEGRLVSNGISGSPRSIRSELRITAANGGSHLDYRVEMVPDRWFPSSIGTHFIRHELAEQFMALGREMKLRQKSRPKSQG